MEEHERGREAFESEDAYRLHALRHTTAHVMAEAIQKVFPEARFAIGPAIKDGFYYDVDVPRPITEDDLATIEGAMKEIVKRNSRLERKELSRDEALDLFGKLGQSYKLELISGLPEGETITVYDQSGFVDLCRGPHAPRTGNCKHHKLLKVSGAYWRGDATGPQLQRIYGTVWPTREELDQHLFRLEEAKKRDHRRLGVELDLFMFHEYAPGAPFFLPKGEVLYHELSEAMRGLLLGQGYVAVRTPQLFDARLWQTSGHWEHYRENMFLFEEQEEKAKDKAAAEADRGGAPPPTPPAPGGLRPSPAGADPEGRTFSLKPMNCPSHMLVFRSKKRSYRELPLRIHDQGVLHRNEVRGALGGLTRVRQFCQDDAHLFVTDDQIQGEVADLLALVKRVYGAFGLGVEVKLSTRPAQKLGDDALWDAAEGALAAALEANGMSYTVNAGDGAFYGPKIDFDLVDALDRRWQTATIQLDYQLPRRFDLSYIGADNAEHRPVVIHRAIFGSLERFIAILVEHFAGHFPTWLAPEQARVLTVSEKSEEHGAAVLAQLQAAGLRATLDVRSDKIGFKIREAHNQRVPYIAVVGERDAANGTVALRRKDSEAPEILSLADFVARVAEDAKRPF